MSNLTIQGRQKKEKIYTEQQQLFLDALPSCQGNFRQAMDVAGFARSTPESYLINILHEEIVEIANKLLAANSIKAASSLINILDEPTQLGAETKLKAAEKILDRAGVTKKTDTSGGISISAGGGLFILPAKAVREAMTIEGELVDDED